MATAATLPPTTAADLFGQDAPGAADVKIANGGGDVPPPLPPKKNRYYPCTGMASVYNTPFVTSWASVRPLPCASTTPTKRSSRRDAPTFNMTPCFASMVDPSYMDLDRAYAASFNEEFTYDFVVLRGFMSTSLPSNVGFVAEPLVLLDDSTECTMFKLAPQPTQPTADAQPETPDPKNRIARRRRRRRKSTLRGMVVPGDGKDNSKVTAILYTRSPLGDRARYAPSTAYLVRQAAAVAYIMDIAAESAGEDQAGKPRAGAGKQQNGPMDKGWITAARILNAETPMCFGPRLLAFERVGAGQDKEGKTTWKDGLGFMFCGHIDDSLLHHGAALLRAWAATILHAGLSHGPLLHDASKNLASVTVVDGAPATATEAKPCGDASKAKSDICPVLITVTGIKSDKTEGVVLRRGCALPRSYCLNGVEFPSYCQCRLNSLRDPVTAHFTFHESMRRYAGAGRALCSSWPEELCFKLRATIADVTTDLGMMEHGCDDLAELDIESCPFHLTEMVDKFVSVAAKITHDTVLSGKGTKGPELYGLSQRLLPPGKWLLGQSVARSVDVQIGRPTYFLGNCSQSGSNESRSVPNNPRAVCYPSWSFAPPFCTEINRSKAAPTSASCPDIKDRGPSTCNTICVFFPLMGVISVTPDTYFALDAWAKRVFVWMVVGNGRAFLDAILSETPVCGRFLCASICHNNAHKLGIMAHFHWTPVSSDIGPAITILRKALKAAWTAPGVRASKYLCEAFAPPAFMT